MIVAKYYLTTAIDYSNGDPHIGHALEKVGADCIARYRRLRGDAVHFVMGMDEHSQAVMQAAEQHGLSPQGWVPSHRNVAHLLQAIPGRSELAAPKQ